MTRNLRPCGTTAAYKRHRRNGEAPCDKCKAANAAARRAQKKEARETTAEVVKLAIVEAPPPDAAIDELEKLRWNLDVVEAAMRSGVPQGLASLAKHHMELVERIKRLESAQKPKESKLDELARRRAERLAAAKD